jgi:transposase
MATARLDDELWKPIEPLAAERRFHYPGRKRIDDRRTLAGILFVLRTIAWQQLPQELGYGSGMTCWRRLQKRRQAGVSQALHEGLLSQLRVAGLRIRYERQAEIHQAFLSLACSLICLRALRGSFC